MHVVLFFIPVLSRCWFDYEWLLSCIRFGISNIFPLAFSKYGYASLLHAFERVLINGHSVYARMWRSKNLVRLGNLAILNAFPIFCHFQETYHHRKLGLGQDTFCLLQLEKMYDLKQWQCSNEKPWIFRLVPGREKLAKLGLVYSIWLTASAIYRLTTKASGPCAMLPHTGVTNETKTDFAPNM